jgi:hypothetical protein
MLLVVRLLLFESVKLPSADERLLLLKLLGIGDEGVEPISLFPPSKGKVSLACNDTPDFSSFLYRK